MEQDSAVYPDLRSFEKSHRIDPRLKEVSSQDLISEFCRRFFQCANFQDLTFDESCQALSNCLHLHACCQVDFFRNLYEKLDRDLKRDNGRNRKTGNG